MRRARGGGMNNYRADVDGVRGISVLLVVFFHAGFGRFGGGFVGVDAFFVISGYLITGLIYADIASDKFSFLKFYERRARRILPALIVVVATTCLIGYYLLYPGEYEDLGRSALAALAAVSNFFFLNNTGYFDAPAQTLPLLHTWSLGVEEQFYFVWPTLLLVISKLSGKSYEALIALLSAIALASFGSALYRVTRDPNAAFYLPYTRAWELAIGGLLIFLPSLGSRLAEVLPLLGLAAILWPATTLTAEQPFPGLNALAPTLGAALIIYPRHTRAGVALGWLAPLGRISYSLYLWHWPIMVFWRTYTNSAALSTAEALWIIALSIGLSILSWRFIEQPARRIRFKYALPVALAGNVAAAAAIAPIFLDGGIPGRVPAEIRAIGNLQQAWDWKCPEMVQLGLLRYPGTTSPAPVCVAGAPWRSADHHAILWGDSNAEAIMPLIDIVARRHNTAVTLVDTCPAILHKGVVQRYWPELPTYNDYCEAARSAVLRLLQGPTHIDTIILAAAGPAWNPTEPLR